MEYWYRGYDGRYGVFDSPNNYTFVTNDIEYALEYVKEYEFGKIARVVLTCRDNEIGEVYDLPDNVDYLDPGDENFNEFILGNHLKGYSFIVSSYGSDCVCISKDYVRVVDKDFQVGENIDEDLGNPLDKETQEYIDDGLLIYNDLNLVDEDLTKEQEEFFQNSVIRDSNGELIPMWHGTTIKFNEFKSPINWFTMSEDYAKEYATWSDSKPVYFQAYLNCQKPFNCGDTSEPIYDLLPIKPYKLSVASKKFIHKLGISEDDFLGLVKLENEQAPNERDLGGFKKKLHVITRMPEFAKIVASKGYDSLITKEAGHVCVGVFNANDIKAIDNKKPTKNNDINK